MGDGVGLGVSLPDLVYPVKGVGEELRYSLRSVAAHAGGLFRKVWLVGDLPSWVVGVGHIRAGGPNRIEDIRAKVTAAANHPGVAERFVLMNDDFYLVEPIAEWGAFHSGTTAEHLARQRQAGASGVWLKAVTSTAEWVAEQGAADSFARQGHRPLLWSKACLAAALDQYPAGRPLDVVGLYALAGAGGVGRRGCNSKVTHDSAAFHSRLAELDIPWLSSNDRSFAEGMIGGYIRGMFRQPCRFEV